MIGMPIDEAKSNLNVKQKLLDKLSNESTMVISTAYAYAKNYVDYGEDITKAWTTAVQQASILEQARQKARVEAYASFKADYEARLKADVAAMLTDIQFEIEEMPMHYDPRNVSDLIQQKINSLKSESEEK